MNLKIPSLSVFLLLFAALPAFAQHSDEETSAFFARMRQEKVEFNQKLSAETDSKAAAIAEFTRQEQADRRAFTLAPPAGVSVGQYNAAALLKKQEFQKKLLKLPKNKLEKAIDARDIAARNAVQLDLTARRRKFDQDQQKKISDFINS